MKARCLKWLDECRLAAIGVVLASKRGRFWAVFIPVFIIFGTLISLLSAGTSAIDLFFAADFGGKMQILGDGFLALFGRGRNFWDFLVNFLLALLQAALIALIVMIFRKRKAAAKKRAEGAKATKRGAERKDVTRGEATKQAEKTEGERAETAGLQNAGIAAGLALLGSGCPTCGTTLITPILTSIFSTGSFAIAGAISGILTAIAFLLLLWSLKKMGMEIYVIIKEEEWRRKNEKSN